MYGEELRSDLDLLIPTVTREEFEDIGSYVQMAATRNQALWENVPIIYAKLRKL